MSKPLILEHDEFLKNIVQNIENQAGTIVIGDLRIEFGNVADLTVPASGYDTVTITFSKAFSTTPAVFLQEKGNYNIKADLSVNTTTEATVNVRSIDGYERTGRSIYWFAIGKN